MYNCSAYRTAAPARRAVQLKCTSDFQPAALHLVAEVNRNENTLNCKTFPTHTSSKGISFASQLRTSRGRPNKDLLKFSPPPYISSLPRVSGSLWGEGLLTSLACKMLSVVVQTSLFLQPCYLQAGGQDWACKWSNSLDCQP